MPLPPYRCCFCQRACHARAAATFDMLDIFSYACQPCLRRYALFSMLRYFRHFHAICLLFMLRDAATFRQRYD